MTCRFPTDWPADCPPQAAQEANQAVFRLVKEEPPSAGDLASHHETGKLPGACPCLRCGLSVLPSLDDALHQRDLMPKLGDHIAQAQLQPMHGKTQHTPSRRLPAHLTWWPAVALERHTIFQIVDSRGDS